MEFRVLGSVEVIEDGRRLTVASGRQLALLAFLLVHANHTVSVERIIEELWGDEPPGSGAKTVAFHMSRLRDALEPGRQRGSLNGVVATETGGYVLRVDPDRIDAVRFEHLASQGRAILSSDPETARARLDEALALWHGEPYAGLADESFTQPEIRRLDEVHLRALEDRLEADLALGRHADVIDELQALVAQEPLRERLRGQLMAALYRAGRQAEALRTYGEGRRVLGDELGIDPGPELQQLEGWILRQDPRLEVPTRQRRVRNPYKGLRPFAEADSPDFFGRDALVARLVERLGDVARAGRLLLVVGPSGSGKSSAIRAGLVPALRAGGLAGSARWPIAVMQPGTRPLRELAVALRTMGSDGTHGDPGQLDHDGDIADAVALVLPDDVAHLVLVVDQLEELWSLVDDAERTRFVAALAAALSARDGRLLVVATLRADFLDRPLRSPGLGELVRAGTELVTPLTRDELERAIVRPAASVGVRLEPGLATEVIADVARQPGELPLLQYALTELFERSDGERLTREGYAAVGGVLGALGRRADDVYAGLDAEGREVSRQAFLRLVVPGESGEPTARRVARSELRTLADDQRPIDEALDAFGRGRLLSFDRDAVTGEPVVQVAHEALLTRWPRLGRWIEEAREDLWTRRRLADAAADWIRAGRDPGFLLAGSRLDLFASWAASTDLRLDLPERELLDASLAERQQQDDAAAARAAHERALERRARNQLRALAAVLAVAALVATSLSVVVYGQGEAAREQGAIASARELAAASIGNLGTDPQLSLLLAWHAADATAGRGYVVEEAMDALHWALQASHVAYPASAAPAAVRTGPDDRRGVLLLAPNLLMTLAATAAGRDLLPGECRTYLHRTACPAASASGSAVENVYTESGLVPVERLASGSLAGSRVDVHSQLPVDLAPLVAAFEDETGIDVTWATGADADLEKPAAGGPGSPRGRVRGRDGHRRDRGDHRGRRSRGAHRGWVSARRRDRRAAGPRSRAGAGRPAGRPVRLRRRRAAPRERRRLPRAAWHRRRRP
ncbi:MAG: winged helix-turn-helix domain-containing protein, partial [Chloroflexi bacterium]|nr:winged helix-turn-helix domain-containing protein [Chloroflexota bacterium]